MFPDDVKFKAGFLDAQLNIDSQLGPDYKAGHAFGKLVNNVEFVSGYKTGCAYGRDCRFADGLEDSPSFMKGFEIGRVAYWGLE